MAERFEIKENLDIEVFTRPSTPIAHDSLAPMNATLKSLMISIGMEYVDLYIGSGPNETHIRWSRKSGEREKPNVEVRASGDKAEGVRNLEGGRTGGTQDRQKRSRPATKA